jgi:hypothetical protein
MAGWIWLHTRALADALGHTRSVIRCAHDRRFRVRRAFPLSFAALMIAVHRRHRCSAFQPSASHLRGLPLCRSQAHDRRFGRPHVTLPFPRGSATSASLMFPVPHQSTNGSMSRSHGTQVIRSGRARAIPRARTPGQARDRCAAGNYGAAPETWPAQDGIRLPRAYAVPACRCAPTCSARTPTPRGYAPRRPAGYAFLTPPLPYLGYGKGITPPVPTHVRSRGRRERENAAQPIRTFVSVVLFFYGSRLPYFLLKRKITKKQRFHLMRAQVSYGGNAMPRVQEHDLQVGPLYFLLLLIIFPQNRYASGRGCAKKQKKFPKWGITFSVFSTCIRGCGRTFCGKSAPLRRK